MERGVLDWLNLRYLWSNEVVRSHRSKSRKEGQFEIYQQRAVVKTTIVDEIAKAEGIA